MTDQMMGLCPPLFLCPGLCNTPMQVYLLKFEDTSPALILDLTLSSALAKGIQAEETAHVSQLGPWKTHVIPLVLW